MYEGIGDELKMFDEFGFPSGEGFGTDKPLDVWSNFGYFSSVKETKHAMKVNKDNQFEFIEKGIRYEVMYRIHPRVATCLQWQCKLAKVY
jgi:hypothetical protein